MHNFKLFPELTNNQLQFYYFESPHKQITEDFRGSVTKVIDGDTIHVKWKERNKPVVVRFFNTAAPELNEKGGQEAQSWLESQILGEEVDVLIDPKIRVGKWGRILGKIIHRGINMNDLSITIGHSIPFSQREKTIFPDFKQQLKAAWP